MSHVVVVIASASERQSESWKTDFHVTMTASLYPSSDISRETKRGRRFSEELERAQEDGAGLSLCTVAVSNNC
jgi:hypothetical protein